MKILMLGWELPPHNSGGLGVACYHLARALAHEGATIDFVLPHRHATPDAIDFMTVHAATDELAPEMLKAAENPYGLRCGSCTQQAYCPHGSLDDIRGLQQRYITFVERQVRADKPKVVHAHDWLTLEAGVRAKEMSGAPLIAHVHATEYDRAGGGRGNPLIHEIEQHGLLMADHIIAVSHATKKLLVSRYQIPESKIEVIHNSSDRLPTTPDPDAVTYTYLRTMQQEGYLVVATVGRLTMQKGLVFFLQAAAKASKRFERFIFVIAGDGEQRDELIELSADLGIADKVIFTGFVRGQAWRDIYSVADVFVMSSVSEPFGLTALEAAQHDTAISLTRQSGVGEVLSHVLRYDYWDTHKLADQLVNLATSRNLRDELATNVAIEMGRKSWKQVAERCMHQYLRVGAAT